MDLADQIIDAGPYETRLDAVRGGMLVGQSAAELNVLRDQLIELRRLKAAAEAQQRFLLDVNFWDDHAKVLCLTCRTTWGIGDGDTLAELNQRADEHTEVCR